MVVITVCVQAQIAVVAKHETQGARLEMHNGLMVWGTFSGHGSVKLVRIVDGQNIEDFLRIMEDVMLPFADEELPLTRNTKHRFTSERG